MKVPSKNLPKLFPAKNKDDLSTYAHRQAIGGIGLALPALVFLIAAWRPTVGLLPWVPLGSISAYYYTGAVSVFAGSLIALAVFLLTYRGYDNEQGHWDRVAAIIAGVAAALVAFFPTGVPEKLTAPSWWTPLMGTIHYSSAAVLFSSFIFFCLCQFPRSSPGQGKLTPDKKRRNWMYRFCGVAIAVCMVWVITAHFIGTPIFWPETLALIFFALSWLVKGKADQTATAAGKQAWHYSRHPRQLAEKAWSALSNQPGAKSAAPKSPKK